MAPLPFPSIASPGLVASLLAPTQVSFSPALCIDPADALVFLVATMWKSLVSVVALYH